MGAAELWIPYMQGKADNLYKEVEDVKRQNQVLK